jgi:hypothetical protein
MNNWQVLVIAFKLMVWVITVPLVMYGLAYLFWGRKPK